ncbi:MAG: lysophospholipid acyltransferase family protein [Desulfobacteraceae bacterium]
MSWIPLPAGRFMGRMLGQAGALVPAPRLRVALENMKTSFGGEMDMESIIRLYRRMFRHFGQMLFEVPHILRMSPENQESYVRFENEHYILDALRRGRGLFVLTAHFGNWELFSAAFSLRYNGGGVVVRPVDSPAVNRILEKLRSRFGAEIIPKQKGMRRILAAVRRGMAVGILLDQNVDWYEGVFVPFLGRRACTNKGLALLALKTGAPVIPAFTVRRPDQGYVVRFEPPLKLHNTGDKRKDVEANTALFTATIERFVRAYPDHWFWFHRRWKTKSYCPLPWAEEDSTGSVDRSPV